MVNPANEAKHVVKGTGTISHLCKNCRQQLALCWTSATLRLLAAIRHMHIDVTLNVTTCVACQTQGADDSKLACLNALSTVVPAKIRMSLQAMTLLSAQ